MVYMDRDNVEKGLIWGTYGRRSVANEVRKHCRIMMQRL